MEIDIDEQIGSLADDMVCTVCCAEFLDVEDLQVHVKQVHLNETSRSRFCQVCTQVFPDIESYALHIRNDHLAELKCCKYCTSMFERTTDLVKHEKKHKARVLYPKISCSHCGKNFNNKNELEKHEFQEHSDSGGLAQRECLPILSSLLNMNVRQFVGASSSNLPYICAVCDTKTPDKSIYLQHLIDKNCRSMSCNECCNVYSKKSKLYSHVAHHMYVKTVRKKITVQNKECLKCKQYFSPVSLKSHTKKCTGMNCTNCNVTFDSVAEYTNHISQHANKMLSLEVCIYCQRQMVGADAMKKHIERAHRNHKHLYKYHCTDCNRIFKHPKFLFAHFYSKHKNLQPYTCNICNEKFRIRKNFTLHIKLDHGSVGFVEFDDNFHVSFTDKKSNRQLKCQEVLEDAVNKDKVTNVESKASGDTTNCEDSEASSEQECQINVEPSEVTSLPTKHPLHKSKEIPIDNHSDLSEKKTEHETVIHKNITKPAKTDDNNEADCVKEEKVVRQERKRKLKTKRKRKSKNAMVINKVIDVSSDDSDAPLQTISKKMKLQRSRSRRICQTPWNKTLRYRRTQNKKFVCAKCNRNCFTYQNYYRHRALHIRNERKTCIKCHANFDSVKELNDHIKTEHSSSKLTETLKKLLEKRRNVETNKPDPTNDAKDVSCKSRDLTTSEKFRNTVKKVVFERSTAKVTITPVDKNKISVKKYLENFTPENNEVKLTVLKHKLSLDTSGVKRRFPLIKLTKFTPEPVTTSPIQLQMPIRFTDHTTDKCEVSVQIVQNVMPSDVNYDAMEVGESYDDHISFDDTYEDYSVDVTSKVDVIPEVAQEVMLLDAQQPNKILHTMSLKNLTGHEDIAIAHMSPQAPFYKISKLKNLLDKDGQSLVFHPPQPVEDVPKDITLPNGKKLVNVNPLAHLLDKNTIDEVLKARKLKCPYYKPKLRNITEAITKAMEKLDKSPNVKKKI